MTHIALSQLHLMRSGLVKDFAYWLTCKNTFTMKDIVLELGITKQEANQCVRGMMRLGFIFETIGARRSGFRYRLVGLDDSIRISRLKKRYQKKDLWKVALGM